MTEEDGGRVRSVNKAMVEREIRVICEHGAGEATFMNSRSTASKQQSVTSAAKPTKQTCSPLTPAATKHSPLLDLQELSQLFNVAQEIPGSVVLVSTGVVQSRHDVIVKESTTRTSAARSYMSRTCLLRLACTHTLLGGSRASIDERVDPSVSG